jgi:hypothetical protein
MNLKGLEIPHTELPWDNECVLMLLCELWVRKTEILSKLEQNGKSG